MKLRTHLPDEVHAITYVKNHHWIEIEDKEGGKTKVNATGVLVGDCTSCKSVCLALSSMGAMCCTHCRGPVTWRWTRPQLSFIPEVETNVLNPSPTGDATNGNQQS